MGRGSTRRTISLANDEQIKQEACEVWRKKMQGETRKMRETRSAQVKKDSSDESKKTEQVNVIGLSWRYRASQAVSQLGRYQCEYKFRSFYFTAHLVFSLFRRPRPPHPFRTTAPTDPELTALICFKYARGKFRRDLSINDVRWPSIFSKAYAGYENPILPWDWRQIDIMDLIKMISL